MSKELADLLFPNVTLTPEDLEKKYPIRNLKEGAKVTRIGPSPTGFVHLGNLYNAIIAERMAHQSDGIFYLRIEDTDNKREVPGAVEAILAAMNYYGIHFDEGARMEEDMGNYWPYRQRQRKDIYQVYAKYLVEKGLAYPCFCSEEKLQTIRETQVQDKLNIGYYDEWASCRNLSIKEIQSNIENGVGYVLRFRTVENNIVVNSKATNNRGGINNVDDNGIKYDNNENNRNENNRNENNRNENNRNENNRNDNKRLDNDRLENNTEENEIVDHKRLENIIVKDAIRGTLSMPKNELDFVILKSDGIPTYHFAHVVDDHLMRTTHVIRGEEWIPSLPMHIQMFDTFGWHPPMYCHTATLMKMDGTSKRKLSKRKDPELALSYYQKEGYVPEALWHYLLTILNSNFEDWSYKNPDKSYLDYIFSIENMSNSGALFDIVKLNDISKEIISKMPAKDVYKSWLAWADVWNKEYAICLRKNKDTALKALEIGRNSDKVRKDLITWNQTCEFMSMYFDEFNKQVDDYPTNVSLEDRIEFLRLYLHSLDFKDDKNTWFDKVKIITEQLGYSNNMKEYKKNPYQYKGSIVDLTNVFRVAITGRNNTPDIWEVSLALGENCVRQRLEAVLDKNVLK